MNTYRVDRLDATNPVVHAGMNSIIYIGDSWFEAMKAWSRADTGKDAWGKPNPNYGVAFSKWSGVNNDYMVLNFKK